MLSSLAECSATGKNEITVETELGLRAARSTTIAGMGMRTVQQPDLRVAAGADPCMQQSWPALRPCAWQVGYGAKRAAIITIATNPRRNMPCAMLVA